MRPCGKVKPRDADPHQATSRRRGCPTRNCMTPGAIPTRSEPGARRTRAPAHVKGLRVEWTADRGDGQPGPLPSRRKSSPTGKPCAKTAREACPVALIDSTAASRAGWKCDKWQRFWYARTDLVSRDVCRMREFERVVKKGQAKGIAGHGPGSSREEVLHSASLHLRTRGTFF